MDNESFQAITKNSPFIPLVTSLLTDLPGSLGQYCTERRCWKLLGLRLLGLKKESAWGAQRFGGRVLGSLIIGST